MGRQGTRIHGSVAVAVAAGTGALVACNAILGGGYEVAPLDAGTPRPDHAIEAGRDARARTDATLDAGSAACSADAMPATKAEFESDLCPGLMCTPTDNAALKKNPHCKDDGGDLVCTLPRTRRRTPARPTRAPTTPAGAMTRGRRSLVAPRCRRSRVGSRNPSTTVYAIGSTAIQPYVAHIAQILAAGQAGAGTAATVIYAAAGSCVGVEAAFAPVGSSPPPISTLAVTANYYDPTLDPNGNPIAYTCALDGTQTADWGSRTSSPRAAPGSPSRRRWTRCPPLITIFSVRSRSWRCSSRWPRR